MMLKGAVAAAMGMLTAAGLAGGVAARVVDSGPGGFTVENVEVVPVTPEAAWDALVQNVGSWWPADHSWFGKSEGFTIDPTVGGCFCEADGGRKAKHMEVAFVDRGKLLRMLGGLGPLQQAGAYGALDWTFDAVPEGTRITLRYRVGGYDPEGLGRWAAVVDKVQGMQLGGLANFLRQPPKPKP